MTTASSAGNKNSAFAELGLAKTVEAVCDEIRELYLADAIPWVVGYSGGKDSSADAPTRLAGHPEAAGRRAEEADPRHLDRYAGRAADRRRGGSRRSLDRMRAAAREQEMPIQPHKLTPEVARLVLGQPDRPGLSGAEPEVPLVHRAAQDQAVEQVHPRGRAEVRRGHPRPRHPQGREPEAGRAPSRSTPPGASATGSSPTPACPTRSSTRRSRTGTTTTSGSSSCR